MNDRNQASSQSGILPDISLKSVTSPRKDGRYRSQPATHTDIVISTDRAKSEAKDGTLSYTHGIYQVNPNDEHSKCIQ